MPLFLPVVIEPYPDELLYSWILRLAAANGLSTKTFLHEYLNLNVKVAVKLDIRKEYRKLYSLLQTSEDAMDLYFKLSTMQFEISFCHPRKQIKYIHNVTRDEDELNIQFIYLFNDAKICPECMKEDVETYGEPYIHRTHQLSGVVACYKHKNALHILHRKKGDLQTFDFEKTEPLFDSINEHQAKYAQYANTLLSSNLCSNYNDILNLINIRFQELNISNKDLQGLLLRKQIRQIGRNVTDSVKKAKSLLDVEEIINALMEIFPDPISFLNALPKHNMIEQQYCPTCRQKYYAVPMALNDGWGCPECDAKLDRFTFLSRIVEKRENNNLKLKNIINAKGRGAPRLLLQDLSTETELTTSLPGFLYGNVNRYGSNRRTKSEAEKIMETYPDFKLLEYRGMSQPATIYHKVCGQSFKLKSFEFFLVSQHCRYCESKNFDFEKFKQQVYDLVGNEYDVLERMDYNKYGANCVKIRHNKCGSIKVYSVALFLQGYRCPKCSSLIREDYMQLMLDKYCGERYKITDKVDYGTTYKFVLLDIKTNEKRPMFLKHIMQEMVRPTPSPILEFTSDEPRVQIDSWDLWYELCKEYREEFGHLCPVRGEWYKGKLISRWCRDQKMLYNKGQLSKDKLKKLQDIDFVFDPFFYKWEKRFEEYKEYVKDTGDYVPEACVVHKGNKVGKWFHLQRTQNNNGKLKPIYKQLLLEFNPNMFDKIEIWDQHRKHIDK